MFKTYILNVLIAVDQLGNAALGGTPDETLSARAWRTEQDGKLFGKFFRPIIDTLALIFLDFNHCENSYLSEINRKQLPGHYGQLSQAATFPEPITILDDGPVELPK